MKDCKTKALFKKGFKSDLKNYRPISLLLVVSKTIEKTIQIQTQEYLDKNGLLVIINQVFAQIFQRILALYNLLILF